MPEVIRLAEEAVDGQHGRVVVDGHDAAIKPLPIAEELPLKLDGGVLIDDVRERRGGEVALLEGEIAETVIVQVGGVEAIRRGPAAERAGQVGRRPEQAEAAALHADVVQGRVEPRLLGDDVRSEERRVGKEWWAR